jgi:hypothetical protein
VRHAERSNRRHRVYRSGDGSTPDVKHAVQIDQQAADLSPTDSHAKQHAPAARGRQSSTRRELRRHSRASRMLQRDFRSRRQAPAQVEPGATLPRLPRRSTEPPMTIASRRRPSPTQWRSQRSTASLSVRRFHECFAPLEAIRVLYEREARVRAMGAERATGADGSRACQAAPRRIVAPTCDGPTDGPIGLLDATGSRQGELVMRPGPALVVRFTDLEA